MPVPNCTTFAPAVCGGGPHRSSHKMVRDALFDGTLIAFNSCRLLKRRIDDESGEVATEPRMFIVSSCVLWENGAKVCRVRRATAKDRFAACNSGLWSMRTSPIREKR